MKDTDKGEVKPKTGDRDTVYDWRCPIFPSGCEGKLGVALESLQGLRDLT